MKVSVLVESPKDCTLPVVDLLLRTGTEVARLASDEIS